MSSAKTRALEPMLGEVGLTLGDEGLTLGEVLLAAFLIIAVILLSMPMLRETANRERAQRFIATASLLREDDLDSFVEALASPGARDLRVNGMTYLHYAGIYGNYEAAVWLLDEGFDVNARTRDGRTVVMIAIDIVSHEVAHDDLVRVVTLFIERGADLGAQDHVGKTVLHYAAEKQEPSFVMLLLRAGADPNHGDAISPLATAIWHGNYNVMEVLLNGGADPDGTDRSGAPLSIAASRGDYAAAEGLLRAGAAPDGARQRPLHAAAAGGDTTMVLLLLEHGASPDATAPSQYRGALVSTRTRNW